MIHLLGQAVWPAFKTQASAERLSEVLGQAVQLEARQWLVIDSHLSPPERLCEVLDATPVALDQYQPHTDVFIAPRPGTQTPWASRASDIIGRCGLAEFSAIERFFYVRFSGIEVGAMDAELAQTLYDRMTQVWLTEVPDFRVWFHGEQQGQPLSVMDLGEEPKARLRTLNIEMGLALNDQEIDYLVELYRPLDRPPTDAELMMFAQANSEHCRHKIFNGQWIIDDQPRQDSLFAMIKRTHRHTPEHTIVAYDDNAAIIEGAVGTALLTDAHDPSYRVVEDQRLHTQIKVETHNHPTAISPDPGAATGAGGEIRDESATGRGARPIAGLTGFSVSDLNVSSEHEPWAHAPPPPQRLASALEIMTEGPIGAARYNNEFGRPNLLGYFRSFSARVGKHWWGYHKPIMLAGGVGVIEAGQTHKQTLSPGDHIVVLGGPSMLIGLGGGAASSMGSGQSDEALDYASVQRGNPEMERRAQEVIDRCWALGENNPIKAIHDVGAGGLSNAIPELLSDGGVGARLSLAAIPSADPSLSPMAIWCNEAQERYVLGIDPTDWPEFLALAEREHCPVASLGQATEVMDLVVIDDRPGHGDVRVCDLPLTQLLGRLPPLKIEARSLAVEPGAVDFSDVDLSEAIERVLRAPTVGSKSFLITIGDRSVGGLTVRDQMVGPYQVPVSDCAITLRDYQGQAGTAIAMGERTPLAIWDAQASVRMAIGEALTNLSGVAIERLERIKLSANWMAAAGQPGQDAALYGAVFAASELCVDLGLSIPVGKDSLSMHTQWRDDQGQDLAMSAPVSMIASAFVGIDSVGAHITPQLQAQASVLVLVDFGRSRMGGSTLAQVFSDGVMRPAGAVPDLDEPTQLKAWLELSWRWVKSSKLLAIHDRSDGGVLACVFEMALAGHLGVELMLPETLNAEQHLEWLFNEELGVVVQIAADDASDFMAELAASGLTDCTQVIGAPIFEPSQTPSLVITQAGHTQFSESMATLAKVWSSTSHHIQARRDNPDLADQEWAKWDQWDSPGLSAQLTFEPPARPVPTDRLHISKAPKVAILREQGVNGQREMAQSFMAAGFQAVDVTMSDLVWGRQDLDGFAGLAVCGGFSYGDVLGAGLGWARSILFNEALCQQFGDFFADRSRFVLGVCNGCQMLSALQSIIPGAERWPEFVHNPSQQFEARLSLVRIEASRSIFFQDMAESILPVVTAHGEGHARFKDSDHSQAPVALRYVDGWGEPTIQYPDNPNGSVGGITGLCNDDGRITILMPHPERLLRFENYSWAPSDWQGRSPWAKMFDNARSFVG